MKRYILSILFSLFFVIQYALALETITISGKIKVEDTLLFEKKKIVIEKGSIIEVTKDLEFAFYIKDGEIIMNGSYNAPIIISSLNNKNEDSNVFFIENSIAEINNAIFKNNNWCLHIHSSKASIRNTIFENNYGGIRFFNSKTYIKKNLFIKNDIAMRFINSNDNIIEQNIFKDNRIGIFLREGITNDGNITKNIFIKNQYDFYAGFFQDKDLNYPYNYFYENPKIFDKKLDQDTLTIINVLPKLNDFPDWH